MNNLEEFAYFVIGGCIGLGIALSIAQILRDIAQIINLFI